MTDRDEAVAGLAEVIAGQVIAYVGECICHEAYTGRNLVDPNCQWHALGDDFASETAAAVLAHLEAQGWAQGREEWGVRYRTHIGEVEKPYWSEATARALYAEDKEERLNQASALVRRRVSEWEPVEDTDG